MLKCQIDIKGEGVSHGFGIGIEKKIRKKEWNGKQEVQKLLFLK